MVRILVCISSAAREGGRGYAEGIPEPVCAPYQGLELGVDTNALRRP